MDKSLEDRDLEKIMNQAQVFASSWSLLGGPFDSGDGLYRAESEKAALRLMIAALLSSHPAPKQEEPAQSVAHAPVADEAEPAFYVRDSDVEALADKRIAGRGAMLHKDGGEGKTAYFSRPSKAGETQPVEDQEWKEYEDLAAEIWSMAQGTCPIQEAIQAIAQMLARHAPSVADAEDVARLDWLEKKLFAGTWRGTLGKPKDWYVRGDYRHTMQALKGNTLREAIDAAMNGGK